MSFESRLRSFVVCGCVTILSSCSHPGSEPGPQRELPPLPPPPHYETAYHVDATGGDDANDGLTEATAWRTLARIRERTYRSGDAILLKRGESWMDETLLIGNAGDSVRSAVQGIPGLDPATSSTEAIWTAVVAADLPGLTYGTAEYPVVVDAYGEGHMPRVRTTRVNWTSGITLHHLASYTGDTGENATLIQYSSHVFIEDWYSTGMYTDFSFDLQLRRVLSENADEHGLYLCHASRTVVVEHCIFRNNPGSGIQTNGEDMDNLHVLGNLVYGNGIAGYNDVRSANVLFARNVFVAGPTTASGGKKAIEVQMDGSGNRYLGNVFVALEPGIPAVGLACTGLTFLNNLFYSPTDAFAGGTGNTFDYNGYFAVSPADHAPTINWGTSFEGWRTASGQDAHSLIADPGFVRIDLDTDPLEWDLGLQAGSPAIDAGSADPDVAFLGAAPDLGARESGEASPVALAYLLARQLQEGEETRGRGY